jgi:hypothetical protein
MTRKSTQLPASKPAHRYDLGRGEAEGTQLDNHPLRFRVEPLVRITAECAQIVGETGHTRRRSAPLVLV